MKQFDSKRCCPKISKSVWARECRIVMNPFGRHSGTAPCQIHGPAEARPRGHTKFFPGKIFRIWRTCCKTLRWVTLGWISWKCKQQGSVHVLTNHDLSFLFCFIVPHRDPGSAQRQHPCQQTGTFHMQRVECGCPSQCWRSVIQIFTFSRDETRKLRSFTRFDNLQTVSCTHLISIVDCVQPRLAWSLPSCWFVLAPWRLDVNCCAVESNSILIQTFFQGASLWNLANVWCPNWWTQGKIQKVLPEISWSKMQKKQCSEVWLGSKLQWASAWLALQNTWFFREMRKRPTTDHHSPYIVTLSKMMLFVSCSYCMVLYVHLQSTLHTPSKIHVSYGQFVCFSSSVLRLGFSTEDFTASLEAVEVLSSESSSKVLRNTP